MPVVHNRGKKNGDKTVARKIVFPKGWDAEGKPLVDEKTKKIATETLLPGAHKTLSQEQFDHLKELFPNEIVNVDDIKDLQAQFPEAETAKPRAGYVAPEDVDALVKKRVEEELRAKPREIPKSLEETISSIAGMDRGDMIALIEKENLDIEHKNYKAPDALRAAVLKAVKAKAA
jgi:hypothetical protein